jgi:o-succinylbenzoate synthase
VVDISPFQVRLRTPIDTAHGPIESRRGFLVAVEYEGEPGVGEATPLAGWTESYEACEEALNRARTVARHLDWGIALARTNAPAARHGLSLAFSVARARSEDAPLYRSLGRDERVERVPVNGTVGSDGSPDATAAAAEELVDSGHDCLKLKVGTNGVETDLERVRAVRNAVGSGVTLRVDANSAWTRSEAERAISGLAALDVAYVEQPLPADDLDGLSALRDRGVGIAVDESLVAHDVETVLEHGAADVVVLKPMVLGGPDVTVEAARTARAAGVEPVVSTTIDAVVARTAAVHVAAAIPEVLPCGLATGQFLETDLAPDPAPVENGSICVPQTTGLGVDQSHVL